MFPKAEHQGRDFLLCVPCVLYSNVLRQEKRAFWTDLTWPCHSFAIIDLSSLFLQLPPVVLGTVSLFSFLLQLSAFCLCSKARTLGRAHGLKINWKPYKCILSLPTSLRTRQYVLTQYFVKKSSLLKANQRVGHQSVRHVACSLLNCTQLSLGKL